MPHRFVNFQATESTADPVAAVEQRVGWEKFVQCVAEAESLAQPETTDIRAELITKYPTIRFFAAAFPGLDRSSYVYRGLADRSYDLSTTLNRRGESHLERHLLRNFIKYSQRSD